jgi:putative ABC transport system permease protein
MTPPTGPSRVANWALRTLTSKADADAVVGDVMEELGASRWRLEWRMCQLIGAAAITSLGRSMRAFRHMARDARRSLRRSPASTMFILLVLTLSIAAATVTFSVVDTVVLRPLPFAADGDLIVIESRASGAAAVANRSIGAYEFLTFRERLTSITGLAAIEQGRFTLTPVGESQSLVSTRATASLFDVLGVPPLLGRTFMADEEAVGRSDVAVLGYELWERRFHGDPRIVGQSVEVTSRALMGGNTTVRSLTVIGVMPRGFTSPFLNGTPKPQRTEIWTPLVIPADERSGTDRSRYLGVVGRLRPGTREAGSDSELNAVAAAVAPGSQNSVLGATYRFVPLKDVVIGPARPWMVLALTAVALVLLIACVNVANLQLSRAAYRSRELSVRASLGATRRHVISSLLAESLMLSLTAAGLAITASIWGIEIARNALPPGIGRADEISLDLRVLVAAITAAVATGILFGVVPAWQASRQDLVSILKQGSTTTVGVGRDRWRAVFTVTQVTFVSVLLVSATLIIASFIRVTTADLGFNRSDLLVINPIGVPIAETRDMLTRLRQLPGVSSVSTVENGSPPLMMAGFGGGASGTMVNAVDAPPGKEPFRVEWRRVSPDYFVSAGLMVLKGHVPEQMGDADVVIDETTALALFGRQDAVGAELIGGGRYGRRRVAAVVKDVRTNGPERTAWPQTYLPVANQAQGYVVVRLNKPAAAVVPSIRLMLEPMQPAGSRPADIRSVEDAFRNITADRRFNATLMGLFGFLAIFIGAAGVYGVMTSIVAQRTREIGVRVALGATTTQVINGVVGHALRYIAIGLLVGLPVAFLVSRIFRGLLFQVTTTDWSIYAIVAGILIGVGFAASLWPALRAARVDPLIALRSE